MVQYHGHIVTERSVQWICRPVGFEMYQKVGHLYSGNYIVYMIYKTLLFLNLSTVYDLSALQIIQTNVLSTSKEHCQQMHTKRFACA
jgi:hypothetical protein